MSSTTDARGRPAALPLALLALLILPVPPAPAAGPADALKPAELRKVLQKVEKRIRKAAEAMEDGDSFSGSSQLRFAGEELGEFLNGSGLKLLLEMQARARQAAGEPGMNGAREALLAIRAGMNPLSDYIVRRDAEVAYQAARRAAEAGDLEAYAAALHGLDAAMLAPLLMARVSAARDAIAGGRAAMAGRNMEVGRSRMEAARSALDALRLAAALSQAVFGLEIAAEFTTDGHAMAAREQLRLGGRALRQALEVAPEELQADLLRAEAEVIGVLDRLSRPLPGDPEALRGALATVKTLRAAQQ